MASVYRRKYRKPGGQTAECTTYTIEVKVGGVFKRLRGYADRKACQELGRKVERLASLREAGEQPDPALTKWMEGLSVKLRRILADWDLLTGRAAETTRRLLVHLADYKQALLDGAASPRQKGPATQKHADHVEHHVKAVIEGIGAKYWSEVKVESVGHYLAGRRAKGLSVQSSNNYIKDCKAFFNWMVRAGRAPENPIRTMAKAQVTEKTRVYVRRHLELDEADALLRATRDGADCYGMTGEERYWLYRIALETALRSSEVRALARANFVLDRPDPMVWLPGDDTKNRKRAELPLRIGTAAELATFLANKLPTAPVFRMPNETDVAWMLRKDLKRAGVAHETEAGIVDFHALRVTCVTWLLNNGVSPKTVQSIARHSTLDLTMNVYARTVRGSLADAAARLPDLSVASRTSQTATGTDNALPGDDGSAGKQGGFTGVCTGVRTGLRRDQNSSPAISPVRRWIGRNKRAASPASADVPGTCQRTVAHQSEREWMGIEPTRSRANDPSTALKAAGPDSEPSPSQDVTDPLESHWRTHWRTIVQNHPELVELLAAWPALPEATRQAIIVLTTGVSGAAGAAGTAGMAEPAHGPDAK